MNPHQEQQPKMETVEQAAYRLVPVKNISWDHNWNPTDANKKEREGFVKGANWQKEPSYSEQDLKAAFEAGESFERECFCGDCDYCLTVKTQNATDFEIWLKEYKSPPAPPKQ